MKLLLRLKLEIGEKAFLRIRLYDLIKDNLNLELSNKKIN